MSSTQTQLSRSTRVGRRTRGRNHSYSPPNLRLLPPPRQPPGERSSSQGAPRPTGAQRARTPAPHRPALQLTAKYPSPRTVTSERQGLAVRKYAVAALPASDFATAILGGLDTESKGWGAVPSRPYTRKPWATGFSGPQAPGKGVGKRARRRVLHTASPLPSRSSARQQRLRLRNLSACRRGS